MTMIKCKISVPEAMEPFIDCESPTLELQRNALLLFPYIKNLAISYGRAAEILGISKCNLIDLFDQMGIPYIDYSINDVESELEYFRKLRANSV